MKILGYLFLNKIMVYLNTSLEIKLLYILLGKEGQEGELLIKGLNVFSGYWNAPHKTTESFTSTGWFKTGTCIAVIMVATNMLITNLSLQQSYSHSKYL